jgi:hypothetical protein
MECIIMAKKKISYQSEKLDLYWRATDLITKLQGYVDEYGDGVTVNIDTSTELDDYHYSGVEVTTTCVVSYERLETDEEFNTRVAAEKAQRLDKKKRKIADEARQHEEYLKLDAIFGKKKKIKLD